MPSSTSNDTSLHRRQRILDHLALSRRARQSSRFDDKNFAALARIQRRLAARRDQGTSAQDQSIEGAQQSETNREIRPAADTQQSQSRPRANGVPADAQEWLDSMAHLMKLHWSDSRFTAQTEAPAIEASISRRDARLENRPAALTGPDQSEIVRLQSRAKAEQQRADLVANLLEQVLSSSAASLLKHQARLEAMQSQINALQGR